MTKNAPSFLLKLFLVLSALLLIPTLSSVTANTSAITINITATDNDCLNDVTGTSPIETMLADANGYQQVNTTWSNGVCTISPVVADALIDLGTSSVWISTQDSQINLQSGVNLVMGDLNLFMENYGLRYSGEFINHGSLTILGTADLNYSDVNNILIQNFGDIKFFSDIYLNGRLDNYGGIHIYGGISVINAPIYNYGPNTTSNDVGGIYLYCLENAVQHATLDLTYGIIGDDPLEENCKPQAEVHANGPLDYYGEYQHRHEKYTSNGTHNPEFPFFMTRANTIMLTTDVDFPDENGVTYRDDVHISNYSSSHYLVLDCVGCESPQKGTLIYNSADLSLEYTPNSDASGQDQFSYRLCDTLESWHFGEAQCSDLITIYIYIITPPTANPASATTMENTPVDIKISYTDLDGISDPLVVELVGSPATVSGPMVSPEDGSTFFQYTPDTDWYGTDTFTYRVCDLEGWGLCSEPATVTVEVIENQHPLAETDTALTVEHTWVEIPVLLNDSDPDGQGLDPGSLSLNTSASHAEALLLQDDIFVYRPAWGWQGSDSFTYEICDLLGACSLGQVNITIGENHPPTGTDDWYITAVNTPIVLDLYTNDTDPDGNIVTELYFDAGLHEYNYPIIYHSTLTYTETDGLIYTPPQDFVGFEEFDYYVIDQAGAYFKAHVVISVGANIYLSEDICTEFNINVSEGDLANVVCPLSLPQNAIFSSQVGTAAYSEGNFTWDFSTSDGGAESQQVVVVVYDPFNNPIGAIYIDLVVNNVPPTITSMTVSPMPLLPDQTMTVSSTFSDPAGTKDEPYTCEVDFGDGSQPVNGTITGNSCTADHSYATPGIYVVWVTVTDKDGGSDTKSNLDFTDGNGSGLFTFDFSSLTPEQIAAMCGTNYHLTVNEGQDAGLECAFFLPPNVSLYSSLEDDYIAYQAGKLHWDFLTSDGPAETQTVVLEVYNDSGLLGLIKLPLKVLNVAPAIFDIELSPLALKPGETVSMTAGFTDPAGTIDAHTCKVDFGDGTVLDGTVTNGTCSASHSYTVPGIYVVWVTVTDKDGGSDTKSNLDFTDGKGSGLFTFDFSSLTPEQIAAMCSTYNLSVDEGEAAALACAFSLPDGSTLPSSVGSAGYAESNLTWDFQTLDGPADSQRVTLTVSSAGTTIGYIYFDLAVSNVAPTATFNPPTHFVNDDPFELSLVDPLEPSPVDAAGLEFDFDCGSGYDGWSSSNTANCSLSPDGVGGLTVRGKIRDKDGGETEYTATITVLPPSAVTNSSLCSYDVDEADGQQFRLIFTPDMQIWPVYKLPASNPGQFFYNIFYVGSDPANFDISIPEPFEYQGANPVHVYTDVAVVEKNGFKCFEPVLGSEIYSGTLEELPSDLPGGFLYIAIHLDFGLKGTTGYLPSSDNHALDAGDQATMLIQNFGSYEFSVSGSQTDSRTIQNVNEFKNIPGFGGLVTDGGEPVPGETVEIFLDGTLLGTVTTDEDGWYMFHYKHTGKPAEFTVLLDGMEVSGTLKANKFVEVGFEKE